MEEIIGRIRKGETDEFPEHQRVVEQFSKIRVASELD
jgi:hypothetical protein